MLKLVATPIGNLGDITLRALEALREADVIYAEDTRHTLQLLNHFSIKKPLVSCHSYNEQERAAQIVPLLREGQEIVYVSDAGMPGVSDPGAALVGACVENDLPYTVLPGASAVLTAAGLRDRFEVIVDGMVAAAEGIAGKPKPDTYLRGAQLLGVPPERCVVVEDAVSGVQAGAAGGFAHVVGVDRGAGEEVLLREGADVVVVDLADLIPDTGTVTATDTDTTTKGERA